MNKLKIDEKIDLEWLMYKYQLIYANHVDESGKYLFYSDTLYINSRTREINIEGRNNDDILFLYDLIKEGLVVKEPKDMNKTIENIVEVICFTIIVLVVITVMVMMSSKDEKIKLLEQSLNEQIEEKQVYMNMLKEERSE